MLFVHKMESVFSLCHLITCGESYGCVSGQLVQWVSVWSTLINRSPFLLDLYISRLLRHKGLCCLHYLLNAKACCSGSSFPSLSLSFSPSLSPSPSVSPLSLMPCTKTSESTPDTNILYVHTKHPPSHGFDRPA